MKILTAKSTEEFRLLAAKEFINQVQTKPNSVIGLSTGKTTTDIHKILADLYKAAPFNTSDLCVFNLDEITNVPRSYEGSCYYMIKNQVCIPLNIEDKNFIMPLTESNNFEIECQNFRQSVEDRGGVDLQLLGIGTNGHIGFNQPDKFFPKGYWVSSMDSNLEKRVRRELNLPDSHSMGGLTLGIDNIMQSRKIILLANGKEKAEIIKKALFGPITPEVPASVLQLHPNCEVILDPDASSEL